MIASFWLIANHVSDVLSGVSITSRVASFMYCSAEIYDSSHSGAVLSTTTLYLPSVYEPLVPTVELDALSIASHEK